MYKCVMVFQGSFNTEAKAAAIYEHSIYTIDSNQITVRAFQVSMDTCVWAHCWVPGV